MRFIAVLALAAAGGCAISAANTRLSLTIQGAAAGAPERQRCLDAVKETGAVVDAGAPVKAIVTLDPTATRLQVMSPTRGLVRDEAKPAGTVEPVCRDAALVAATTPEAGTLNASAPPGPDVAPPPSSPTASGGAYRGPISQ